MEKNNLNNIDSTYTDDQDAIKVEDNIPKRICVIGCVGAGKSSLCNTISGTQKYLTSSGIESCTTEVACNEEYWRGNQNQDNLKFELIDTPGLGEASNESDNLESDIIKKIVQKIKDLDVIDAFLIVFKF